MSTPPLKPLGLMQLAPLLAVLLAVVVALLAAWALSLPAPAQSAKPAAEDAASYAGADRIEKLVAAAKQEGSVSVYTSAAMDDMGAITAAFEKKYGIKVRLWRGSSENIVQRAVVEPGAARAYLNSLRHLRSSLLRRHAPSGTRIASEFARSIFWIS